MILKETLQNENATHRYFQKKYLSYSGVPLQAGPFRSKQNLYHQEPSEELEPLWTQESPDKIQQDVVNTVSSIKY